MGVKRALILAPAALVLLFLQAYLWVPAYDSPERAGSGRRHTFIESSIGDAKLLNPILHADTASGRIVDLVFDGLLEYDENLDLEGALARSWTLTEEAWITVNRRGRFADGERVTAAGLMARLRRTLERDDVADLASDVRGLELVAGRQTRPARVKISLSRVHPDLFERLQPALGEHYGDGYGEEAQQAAAAATRRRAAEPAGTPLPLREHNPVLTFALRRGVRFHDGHEFDAGDVRFTFDAIMEPRNLSPRRADFEPVKRLDTPDAHTVRITYKRLFSPAVEAWTIGILPQHLLAQADSATDGGMRASPFNRQPVGTGAFRFVTWRGDDFIHLRRNDQFWREPAGFEHYYFRIIPDTLTQEIEFRAGAVDAYRAEPHQAGRYREDERYTALSAPGLSYAYIGWNMRRELFSDARVRRALSLAVDVESIIRYVLNGEARRTTGPYAPTTRWYDPDSRPLPHDPARARRILEDLGWRENGQGWLEKDGRELEFTLVTNNGNAQRRAIMAIAQDSWRRIGVRCHTQLFEWAVLLEDFINKRDFDAVVLGWSLSPDADLYQLWHSSQSGENQLNFVGYRDAESDRLLEAIRREYDLRERTRLARKLHRRIAQQVPYTFLYAPVTTWVLDRRIGMLDEHGRLEPVRPGAAGNAFEFFERWARAPRARP